MKKCGAILILLMLTSPQAIQAAGRFYAGFALGEAKVSRWCNSSPRHCNDSDIGLKLSGGFQITPHWGIEAAYLDLGQVTASFTESGPPSFRADIDGFMFSGTGTLPVSKKIDIFAKAGVFRWHVDSVRFGVLATQTQQRNGSNFSFGTGLGFLITQAIQLRIEWEQFEDIGDQNTSDINLWSGGMVFLF